MDKYAKLIDNTLEFAPQNKGEILNYNLNVEAMVADGYKLFVDTPLPTTNREYHIEYKDKPDCIQAEIVYDETQEEADARILQEAKNAKYAENEKVREDFLVSGVCYKDIMFDSDIEQKLNISIQVSMMPDGATITWVGMDGITSLECTKEDLLNIGGLLTAMTTYVWQIRNPGIKLAIQNATTLEELDEIDISYVLDEITNLNNL